MQMPRNMQYYKDNIANLESNMSGLHEALKCKRVGTVTWGKVYNLV
jgi:hypothetical protein